MKKFLTLLAMLLSFCIFAQESKYIEQPLDVKCAAKDLTFLVTFDKHSVQADFAKGGDTKPKTMQNVSLMLRGQIGFDGQPAYKPEPDEKLRYKVKGNVNPNSGTLILWTASTGYNPSEEKTNGEKRGNVTLAHIWTQDSKDRWIEYQLYEFADTIYFDWRSSEDPDGWGSIGRINTIRKGIKKDQWHQIALTWDGEKMQMYLNGEFRDETTLPVKAKLTRDFVVEDNANSFIGVKSPFYEDNHKWDVAVDDFAIYSRPLTALEIKNQYAKLLKDKKGMEIQAYSIELNGVAITPHDKVDKLEAEFDFSALPDDLAAQLKAGTLQMDYTLEGPDGSKQTGTWTFSKNIEDKILSKVDKPGKYTLTTSIGNNKVVASTERPDFSWVGNNIANEDEVPEIWKDFAEKNRVVTLWNRTYSFGKGPLPEKILCYGKSILDKAPALLINGKEPKWKAGKTSKTARTITYKGTGKLDNCKISYETTVEFDGFIRFQWNIEGEPTIDSMFLNWKMAPENHEFLMTPRVNTDDNPKQSYVYPSAGGNPGKLLWFVSEKKGGFAYTMVNDANWIYDATKPVLFADKSTGECRVDMITKSTKMPKDTPYQALFIATPTRPLPKENRIYGFSDVRGHATPSTTHAGGNGLLNTVFTHAPQEGEKFDEFYKDFKPNTVSVYGGYCSLTTHEPMALYLKKYWEVPRGSTYKMPFLHKTENGKYETRYYFSLPCCPSSVYSDYCVWCDEQLFKSSQADKIWQVYYDLCGHGICANPIHGCAYKDKFGRMVQSFYILHKRDLIRRTVTLAHRYGKTVMLHGQWDFAPMLQGMADYWYPGEQYNTLLIRNPFGYVDEVPDAVYRSEFNRDTLGVGIVHLPALGHASNEHHKAPSYKYTEAMLAMLQSHDVDTCVSYAASLPVFTLWDIMKKYGANKQDTQCVKYYEQPREVLSSNDTVRVTYYKCPGDKYILFICSKDIRPQKASIDVNGLKKGDFAAFEEYKGKDISVKNGKFDITIPPRSFRVVCFPPIPDFPITDTMEDKWSVWRGDKCDTDFSVVTENGNKMLAKINHEMGNGCFLKTWSIKPNMKYKATIKFKQLGGSSKVGFSVQAKNQYQNIIDSTVITSPQKEGSEEWQELTLTFETKEGTRWADAKAVMFTLGGGTKGITTFYDDLTIDYADQK